MPRLKLTTRKALERENARLRIALKQIVDLGVDLELGIVPESVGYQSLIIAAAALRRYRPPGSNRPKSL